MTARNWSSQQTAIFSWFAHGRDSHLVVRARAGTGKTTTIIEGVNHAPEASILICAYNKRIAEELQARTSNPAVTAKTLHAVGYAAVRKFRQNLRVSFNSDRADALTTKVCGTTCPDTIAKLVSKLHTLGRETAPHSTFPGDLTNLMIDFELEPGDEWQGTKWDGVYVEAKALEAMELASQVKSGETIDGSDMIFLPVRNGWLTKSYDMVVVDEAQDMTTTQLEIAQGVCRGRIAVIGDDRQAIYGFRGADSGSLDRLKRELNATELGLTVTYRCGQAIVAAAQTLVPDFVAGAGNPEGLVASLGADRLTAAAGPGDFILSRLNAPLVSIAMNLLRQGKRTRVAGQDIGKGLMMLVRKMKAKSVPDLLTKIAGWETREVARMVAAKRQDRVEGIRDRAEMLIALSDGAKNVDEVVSRIDALFTDDGLGAAGVITCSSVHRSKGLEADRVFVLQGTLRDHNQEEKNIAYVSITRAKRELVWVVDNKG